MAIQHSLLNQKRRFIMKKLTGLALAIVMVATLSACGGGGSTTAGTGTPLLPSQNPDGSTKGAVPPTVEVNTVSILPVAYSLKTPGAITVNYNVSFNSGVASETSLSIGAELSNSATDTTPETNKTQDYQILGGGSVNNSTSIATNLTGSFPTSSSGAGSMIEPTPFAGIDYSKPTYIIVIMCAADLSKPNGFMIQPTIVCGQKSTPITITP
jgi:hypothetical protein